MNTPSVKSSADARTSAVTLIKLGGSLLDLPDVVTKLVDLLSRIHRPVVIPGGGAAADLVRSWDQRYGLAAKSSHKLAMAGMSFNALRLTKSCDRCCLVSDQRMAEAALQAGRIPIIDITAAVLEMERSMSSSPAPPESWDVTSDSIAAWLARNLRADLWLLKSVRPGPDPRRHLDPGFETASEGLTHVTWVSFRETPVWTTVLSLPLQEVESGEQDGKSEINSDDRNNE